MFVQCIVYCVQCTPFPLWLKSVPGWPAISVSTWQQSDVGQIVWFGCLSAILQLASRVGEGGGVRQLCLHSVTQPYATCLRWREQGGGLCSLPLDGSCWRVYVYCVIIHATQTQGRLRNVRIGIGKTWCIHNGVNIATGIIAQLPTSRSIHCSVANIAKRS